MLCIIALWALGLALGWTLLIWAHLPGGLYIATDTAPGDEAGFFDALYLSLVTLGPLGYGDMVPTHAWLQLVLPIEA